MASVTGVSAGLHEKFAGLGQSWIEAVEADGRVKLSVTEAARKAWKEEGAQRKPTLSAEAAQALTSAINEALAENPSVWVSCGVDTELYFQSGGLSQVRTPVVSSDDHKPLLRYWEARGRAQALRYLLSDVLGADGWVEEALSFTRAVEWKTVLKPDVEFCGPWHTLPAVRLSSSKPLVSQTEAIARYLGRHYGIAGANPETSALADSLTCATYQAVTTVSMKTLYAVDEVDILKELETMKATYTVYLDNLVEILGDKPFFVDPVKPLYCDYFVLDALQHVREFLGLSYLSSRPSLAAYLARMESRPHIVAQIARTHPTWCYSPREAPNFVIVRSKLQN